MLLTNRIKLCTSGEVPKLDLFHYFPRIIQSHSLYLPTSYTVSNSFVQRSSIYTSIEFEKWKFDAKRRDFWYTPSWPKKRKMTTKPVLIRKYHYLTAETKGNKRVIAVSNSGVKEVVKRNASSVLRNTHRIWHPRLISRGCQFQATENATKSQNTTLKTYGELSLFTFLTLYQHLEIKRCKILCFMKHF